MMKKILHILKKTMSLAIVAGLLSLLSFTNGYALDTNPEQPILDTFPTYSITNYNITIPKDTAGFTDDPANEICGRSMALYIVNGMIAPTPNGWLIDDASGSQNSDNVNSPTAKLCKLLEFYKLGVIDSVVAQYKNADQANLNTLLANTNTRARFQELIDSSAGMRMKFGMNI